MGAAFDGLCHFEVASGQCRVSHVAGTEDQHVAALIILYV
jgi:hypothetical protein